EDDGATHTVEWPRQALPFKADMAIRISGQEAMTFYEYHNDQWWPVSYSYYDGSHGVSGGTEVKFHLKHDLTALQDIRMLAYARDNDDQVWAMFPTTNPLEGNWEAYYHWNTVCNPLLVINANQPRYTSMAMVVAGEAPQTAAKTARLIRPSVQARGAWATTTPSSSGNAVGGILGPGSQVTYTIALENRETYTAPVTTLDIASTVALSYTLLGGATCDVCPPLGDTWKLLLPPIPAGEHHTITLTQTLPDDLTGITTLPFTATLALSDTVLAQDWLAYAVDSRPPTLTLDSQIVCPGTQTISGRANDFAGGGLRAVQVSTDGATWQDAFGLHNWTAQVNVPVGVETFEVWLRAVDVFSQALDIPFTLRTDTNAPTLTLALPAYLTGDYGKLGGMATDVGSWIERVEVQIGDETAPWQAGNVYPANGGEQRWAFTWNLPRADGVPVEVRARVADAGCNVSPTTPWMRVPIDNAPPVITTTQAATVAPLGDYLADGAGAPVLAGTMTDGSGVASASVTLVDPAGRAQIIPLTLDGDRWAFTPQLGEGLAGVYTMRVEAVDAAGNRSISRRYELRAMLIDFTKTVAPVADVPLGGVVTYTLTLRNHSAEPLAGSVITDPLPAEVTPLTQTAGTAFLPPQGNTLEWGPLALAGGDAITLSFTARVTTDTLYYGAAVSNTAYVSAPGMASIASEPAEFIIAPAPGNDIYLPLVTRN
ncbi:MAG: hypothetical protein ACLFTI_09115, partial [Anaerolineales bacterium]